MSLRLKNIYKFYILCVIYLTNVNAFTREIVNDKPQLHEKRKKKIFCRR